LVAEPNAAIETPVFCWAKLLRTPLWLAEVTTNPIPASTFGPVPSGWMYWAG
jgi:hypothetical protein